MSHADNNQSRAAEWLGLNRNTLRKEAVRTRAQAALNACGRCLLEKQAAEALDRR